jgi:hypothetical protein
MFAPETEKELLVYNAELSLELANKYKESVDLIVSHQVLEHVVDLPAIFEMFDIMLRPGGQMFHKVDLSDHLYHGTSSILKAIGLSDPVQDSMYLSYSDRVFNFLNSSKCYMNRKLLPFYIGLIKKHRLSYTLEDLRHFEGHIHNDVLREIDQTSSSFTKILSFSVFIHK